MARLRRSACDGRGIARVRRGRGFSYHWWTGQRVADADTLERIRGLAIPPAWNDVWICPWPNGHIQAIGTDAAGRRQYRYHDAWQAHRDREKFDRVLALGRSIDRLRARVRRDLRAEGMEKDRVVAAIVRLLDVGCFRTGGEEYAAEHETFGVTTLRTDHVRIRGDTLVFTFPAKGSKWQTFEVRDKEVLPIVRALRRRRGAGELFAHKEGRRWKPVRSDDVNAYIKRVAGSDYTAKDLRTWSATVHAAVRLAAVPAATSTAARRRAVTAAVKDVAEHLGNTPAVCRASYVDPRVIDRFEHAEALPALLAAGREGPWPLTDVRRRSRLDAAVVALIEEELPASRAA